MTTLIVEFNADEMSRLAEVLAYARTYRISISEAIIQLVNSGLSHQ